MSRRIIKLTIFCLVIPLVVVLGVVKAACTQPNSIMECLVCAFDIAEGVQVVLSHDGKCIGISFIPIPHIFIVVVDTCRKGERL